MHKHTIKIYTYTLKLRQFNECFRVKDLLHHSTLSSEYVPYSVCEKTWVNKNQFCDESIDGNKVVEEYED